MGSIIDYIECPNCKKEASDDLYYKTGEEYINCGNCGYHYSATIVNRDKKLNELTDSDWKIIELKSPFGAYRIKTYNSVATECGSLEFCSVSRFINGEIVDEMIVDNGPEIDSAGFSKEDRQASKVLQHIFKKNKGYENRKTTLGYS